MNEHLKEALWRLTGLLRTRVIICMVGLYIMKSQPAVAEWVVAICGLALGVSAIDSIKGVDNGRVKSGNKGDGSQDS